MPTHFGMRLLGGLGGHGYLVPTGDGNGSCRWEKTPAAKWRKLGDIKDSGEDASGNTGLEELIELAEEVLERLGARTVFFRDPSGEIFPQDLWYPAKSFWGAVKAKTVARLHRR